MLLLSRVWSAIFKNGADLILIKAHYSVYVFAHMLHLARAWILVKNHLQAIGTVKT